jgi:hypothetical protein
MKEIPRAPISHPALLQLFAPGRVSTARKTGEGAAKKLP